MTQRAAAGLVAGVALLCACALAATALVFTGVVFSGSGEAAADDACLSVVADTGSLPDLDAEQSRNAHTIIAVGASLNVEPKGLVVAIATAMQESTLRNLDYGDRDSVGLFQQRDAWGSFADRTNPEKSARMFFTGGEAGQRGLLDVNGGYPNAGDPPWEQMEVWQAAQAVQVSAYPNAYARWEKLAYSVVAASDPGATNIVPAAMCQAVYAAGTVIYPVDKATDNRNYGTISSIRSLPHTGTDFSIACGTPVRAATGGKVVRDSSQAGWAGPNFVKVTTGAGKLTTWYAHMQSLNVRDGQTVSAGDVIGAVGSLGNSTGCHLHFEVHPKNGGITEDGVNPSTWLEQNVGKDLDDGRVVPVSAGDRGFNLASFNVLGDSHTDDGGKKASWASGPARIDGVIRLLDKHSIDVVGFQEFQGNQKAAFEAKTGNTWQVWSGSSDTENSLAWRTSSWQFVSGDTVAIPYFNGHARYLPVVRLRSTVTGRDAIFLNVHNPANTARFHNQEQYRDEATRREVRLIANLIAGYRRPVYVTGDFNERGETRSDFTASGALTAAADGSYNGIDWIFGPAGTAFSGWTVDRSPVSDHISDHPLVATRVGF